MNLKGKKQKRELAEAIDQGRRLLAELQEQEAFDFLDDAVRRFPEDAEIRLLYASILLAFRLEDVAPEAARAVELAPDNPSILVRAADLMVGRGEIAAARDYAARADGLIPPDFVLMADLLHINSVLAALDGEDDLAEEKLRSAVKSEPSQPLWPKYLAVFLAERGRLQEGSEVLDEALKHVEKKDELEHMRDRMAAEAAGS